MSVLSAGWQALRRLHALLDPKSIAQGMNDVTAVHERHSAAQLPLPKVCNFHGGQVPRRRQQQILQLEVPVGHAPALPRRGGTLGTKLKAGKRV